MHQSTFVRNLGDGWNLWILWNVGYQFRAIEHRALISSQTTQQRQQ
jgi:hypothetical protein